MKTREILSPLGCQFPETLANLKMEVQQTWIDKVSRVNTFGAHLVLAAV